MKLNLTKFRISVNYKYLTVFAREFNTESGESWNSGTVYSLHDNSKLSSFSFKDMQQLQSPKYRIMDHESHPLNDELVLVYNRGGWVSLIDVIKGWAVWEVREKNFFRDIGDVNPASIEQCKITPDGQTIIIMTT